MKTSLTVLLLVCALGVYAQDRRYDMYEGQTKPATTPPPAETKPEVKPAEAKPQNPTKPTKSGGFDWDRVQFGGNFGFGSNGNVSILDISPMVLYRTTDRTVLGVGGVYRRWSTNLSSINITGGRLLGRYMVTDNLFPQFEYEPLAARFDNGFETLTVWNHHVLVGGTYAEGPFQISALYNLNHANGSFYPSPFVLRGGIFF